MDLQPNKTDAIIKPITNTRISASEWNQLVGSCMEFITQAGMTPDANDNEQFLNAFKTIAAGLEIVGANTNLSNLTATGEARFTTKADTDLSNVNNTGTSTSAGWAMPSTSYENITVGASGASYTAPANGYFVVYAIQNQTNGYVRLDSGPLTFFGQHANVSNFLIIGFIPIMKGNSVLMSYGGIAIDAFRFVYALGSESEAN